MKVVHLIGGDEKGGAARGALWLHQALLNKGVASSAILQFGGVDDTNIQIVDESYYKLKLQKLRRICDQIPFRIYPKHKRYIFSPGIFGLDFTNHKLVKNADIVHLHWIANVFVDLRTLNRFNKPIIWTFRDMWPFTGGCHNSLECFNYKTGCGNCPHLGSNRLNDLSRWLVKRKEKNYQNNFIPVAVSNWMKDAVESSYLFRKRTARLIFNGLNTNIFRPFDRIDARKKLNLPIDKKIVLIEGQATKHIWKGTKELNICLERLKVEGYLFLFFGEADNDFIRQIEADSISLGRITDDSKLAKIYSSSDVYLTAALQEPFGKTIIESMACGTPVVCFNANGPKDIVDHKINGYKAVPFDPFDLSEGVKWLISNKEKNNQFGIESIKKVKNHFDINIIAEQYINLYSSSLKN
jgi:glycosyltransferase involved in cell wall biosynthesis